MENCIPSFSHDAPELKTIDDGLFAATEKTTFIDEAYKAWIAPAETITDGASLPNLFARFFGGRLAEDHLLAAIVHDAFCAGANEKGPVYQKESWQDTNLIFFRACLANGKPPLTAKLMYAGVRLGGPRWPEEDEEAISKEQLTDEQLLEEMGDSLTTGEIDEWMEKREALLKGGKP